MKLKIQRLIVFSLVTIMLLFSGFVKNSASTVQAQGWVGKNFTLHNGVLVLGIVPSSFSQSDIERANTLTAIADASMMTSDPLFNPVKGPMATGDVVVVTPSMILWFDATTSGNPTTNGGGGMLRGIWPIVWRDGYYHFERLVNDRYYSPNYLYTGTVPGSQASGSGISLLMNYGANVDNGVVLAIEHENGSVTGTATGLTINEPGGFGHGGVYVQFTGYLKNSPGSYPNAYIQSATDSDPSGVVGATSYVLTYRVHPTEREFRQEISLTVQAGTLGPLGTMVVSTNLPGYDGKGTDGIWRQVYFGSDVDLGLLGVMPITPYNPPFYNAPNVRFWGLGADPHTGSVKWKETPPGTGGLISMGNPTNALAPVRFLEIKPQANYLPAAQQNTHVILAIDNQQISGRVFAMDWAIFEVGRNPNAALRTFPQGSNIYLISDYKIRDDAYSVIKTQGTGTTINAISVANKGEAFTFTATANAGYDATDFAVIVQVNGTAVTPAKNGDNYTIPAANVTGNIEIITSNLKLITGLNMNAKEDAINVYGTETGLAAQFAGEAIVELYTINGILIDKAQACQFYSHNLDKGVYILRLNGQAVKFVK